MKISSPLGADSTSLDTTFLWWVLEKLAFTSGGHVIALATVWCNSMLGSLSWLKVLRDAYLGLDAGLVEDGSSCINGGLWHKNSANKRLH